MINMSLFFTDFKTEEELLSYIHENYQKTVATGEMRLYSGAQNMISTIKAFLKARGAEELEVRESDLVCHRCSAWFLLGALVHVSGKCRLCSV